VLWCMLPVFSSVIKFAKFEKRHSMTITKRRNKCYQTPENLFSSLWFWWLICKTYLIFKICGKIDLKINCSVKMPLHGPCRLLVIPQKISQHDVWGIEGNFQPIRVKTQIRVVTSQQYGEFLHSFLRSHFYRETIGELWNVGWFLRLYVSYKSQLVLEWIRSLLLL